MPCMEKPKRNINGSMKSVTMTVQHQRIFRHLTNRLTTKKDKKVWATLGKRHLLSQTFKLITTARHQVTMKEISSTIESVEMRFSINIVDRAGVRLIKTIETREGGSLRV